MDLRAEPPRCAGAPEPPAASQASTKDGPSDHISATQSTLVQERTRFDSSRASRWWLALFGALSMAMVGAALVLSGLVAEPAGAERLIIIPVGTAALVAQGEDVAIIPTELHLRLRDRMVVVNEDVVAHQIGPHRVAPGQRLTTTFRAVTTVQAFCSLHPSGRVRLEVAEPNRDLAPPPRSLLSSTASA